MATCPECEFEIDVDELDVDKGDTLECDNCGTSLEVVRLNPITLEAVPEDDDDDEDEDEDDEDEDEEEEDEDE
jgi:alpha-aminoadipate carrier protein LysW